MVKKGRKCLIYSTYYSTCYSTCFLPLMEPPVKLTHLRRSKVTHQNAGEDLEFLLAER